MKTTVNGIGLGYDDVGAGPAVVLLHGFPMTRRMWDPQVESLAAAGYRVILPDLRGFGESECGEAGYDVSTFADDIVGLLNYLGIGRAVIGGISMGGDVLLNLLERYRRRIVAAGLFATRSRAFDGAEKVLRCERGGIVLSGDKQTVADTLISHLFAEKTLSERPELIEKVRNWIKGTDSRVLTAGILALRNRKDYTALRRTFDLPVLMVGAEHDRWVRSEHIRFLASALPCCSSCIIPGAGHLVNMERPAEFNDCLLDFLKGLTLRKQPHHGWRKVA